MSQHPSLTVLLTTAHMFLGLLWFSSSFILPSEIPANTQQVIYKRGDKLCNRLSEKMISFTLHLRYCVSGCSTDLCYFGWPWQSMKCTAGCPAVAWGFDLILLGLHGCLEEALMIKMLFSSLPRVYVMHMILPLNLTLVACRVLLVTCHTAVLDHHFLLSTADLCEGCAACS